MEASGVKQPFTPDEAFRQDNPVPQDFQSLDKLWAWHQALIDAELRPGESEPAIEYARDDYISKPGLLPVTLMDYGS